VSLNKEQKAYFRNLLRRILDELSVEAKLSPASSDQQLLAETPDFMDRASLEIDSALTFRIKERDGMLARKVRDALRKLDEGTFGRCEDCGCMIPEKRLLARPVATRCIQCKEKQENGERVRGI
jgi:DnaK suppressor protein